MKYLSGIMGLTVLLATSCSPSYRAEKDLSPEKYNEVLTMIAPYVIKKPDEFSYDERFNPVHAPFYQNFIKATGGELRYYHKNDTAQFFFFCHKDLSSLFEHYRGLGGYFKEDSTGIYYLNILYHTPRLTSEEMLERGEELFETMVETGRVDSYVGNKKYIHTPNQDFFYNTKTNRWDYTENSSWKFLDEARQQADSVSNTP
jgi:hypothetical protein